MLWGWGQGHWEQDGDEDIGNKTGMGTPGAGWGQGHWGQGWVTPVGACCSTLQGPLGVRRDGDKRGRCGGWDVIALLPDTPLLSPNELVPRMEPQSPPSWLCLSLPAASLLQLGCPCGRAGGG